MIEKVVINSIPLRFDRISRCDMGTRGNDIVEEKFHEGIAPVDKGSLHGRSMKFEIKLRDVSAAAVYPKSTVALCAAQRTT